MFYIKGEFHRELPILKGSIMAMALHGAIMITTCSWTLADAFGR
jgi:hypothetical protein